MGRKVMSSMMRVEICSGKVAAYVRQRPPPGTNPKQNLLREVFSENKFYALSTVSKRLVLRRVPLSGI